MRDAVPFRTSPKRIVQETIAPPKCFSDLGAFAGLLRYIFGMPKDSSQDKFLGGGISFNQAGYVPPETDPLAGDTGPIALPTKPTRHALRTLITVIIIVLLASGVYYLTEVGLGGVTHTQGHGVSPDERPTGPPKNF